MEITGKDKYFWHWGDQDNTKAYFTANLSRKEEFVFFAKGFNGLSVAAKILDDAIGGNHPALAYLGYDQYDSPSFEISRDIFATGAITALNAYRLKRAQKTIDFPNCADAWESLADAYLKKDDQESAIRSYRKSLELKPNNQTVIEKLNKLKS